MMKEIGFGATCGRLSSLSLNGSIIDDNGRDNFSGFSMQK